jgi:hypothetical protein
VNASVKKFMVLTGAVVVGLYLFKVYVEPRMVVPTPEDIDPTTTIGGD